MVDEAASADLRSRVEELEKIVEPFGMKVNLEALNDPERSLQDSIDHALESHTRVSRKLAATLDDLEEALEKA